MTYEPGSMVGHGTGLFTGNRARRYLSFAAFTDGASQDHTVSSWSPIIHRPSLVLEINIKENPNVVCFQPRGQGHVKNGSEAILDCCVLRFVELTARHTIRAPGTSNVLRGHPCSCQKLDVVASCAELRIYVTPRSPKLRAHVLLYRISLRIHHNSGHTGGIEPLPPSVIVRCSTSELTVCPELCPGL